MWVDNYGLASPLLSKGVTIAVVRYANAESRLYPNYLYQEIINRLAKGWACVSSLPNYESAFGATTYLPADIAKLLPCVICSVHQNREASLWSYDWRKQMSNWEL